MMPRARKGDGGAAPALLVAFFAATLIMVVAVVVLLRDGSDWVDFVAIGLLIAVAGLLLMTIGRELRDEEPPDGDEPEVPGPAR